MASTKRCAGCGLPIEAGADAVCIRSKRIEDFHKDGRPNMSKATVWGYMHRLCFLRSVRSPELILEEHQRERA